MAISASSWVRVDGIGLNQAITDTSTTKQHALGERIRCKDVSSNGRGFAEFVYGTGVASTVAGDVVTLKLDGSGTTRATARAKGAIGVAMSANVASQYGWYQVTGVAVATSGTVASGTTPYLTATAGSIDDAVVTGDILYGGRIASTDDTGQCLLDMGSGVATQDTDNA